MGKEEGDVCVGERVEKLCLVGWDDSLPETKGVSSYCASAAGSSQEHLISRSLVCNFELAGYRLTGNRGFFLFFFWDLSGVWYLQPDAVTVLCPASDSKIYHLPGSGTRGRSWWCPWTVTPGAQGRLLFPWPLISLQCPSLPGHRECHCNSAIAGGISLGCASPWLKRRSTFCQRIQLQFTPSVWVTIARVTHSDQS